MLAAEPPISRARLRHHKFPRICTIEPALRLLGTRFVAPGANFKLRNPIFFLPQWKTMEESLRDKNDAFFYR